MSTFRGSLRFHSGKKRARETAELMAWHLGAKITASDGLSPLDDPLLWKGRLEEAANDTMLVGHLPHLKGLAGLLVVGDKDRDIIDFKMGGIVCLRKKEGRWRVAWAVTPEVVGEL